MIAVDTNIIVRLLTQDDAVQFQKSVEIFKAQEIFIADTVVLETEWVLRFAYKFKPTEIVLAFRNLFGLSNVYLAHDNSMAQVLQWHENGLDFADALHLSHSQHCAELCTFDERFAKKSKGLTKCGVKKL